jgi:hypothetical protein
MATVIRIKRGLEADILPLNLPLGEPVFATDTNRLFVGTGAGVTPIQLNLADLIATYNTANNLVKLDGAGLIPESLLPKIAITTPYVVADATERDALTAEEGDVAIVTSENKSYILDGTGTWLELKSPTAAVDSVNGQTGAVTLALDDLSDVASATPTTGYVLTWDGAQWIPLAIPSGVTAFTELSDVPSSYTGSELYHVRVNATGTELEFTNEIDGGTI